MQNRWADSRLYHFHSNDAKTWSKLVSPGISVSHWGCQADPRHAARFPLSKGPWWSLFGPSCQGYFPPSPGSSSHLNSQSGNSDIKKPLHKSAREPMGRARSSAEQGSRAGQSFSLTVLQPSPSGLMALTPKRASWASPVGNGEYPFCKHRDVLTTHQITIGYSDFGGFFFFLRVLPWQLNSFC